MTLSDWQRIAAFYNEETDEIEQMALLICDLYGLSGEDVDRMSPNIFKVFSFKVAMKLKSLMRKPLWCTMKFETDATKISFGQFIEVQYFLQNGPIESRHLIAASVQKGGDSDHRARAEKLRHANARYILSDTNKFLESLDELMNSYPGLFEQEEVEEDMDEAPRATEVEHPFITQYGWIFSAKKVADHEGMKLNEVFEIPVIQALNDLSYLKSEQAYLKKISK